MTKQPSIQKPSAEQPSAEQPSAEQPSIQEPSAEQPSAEQPDAQRARTGRKVVEPTGVTARVGTRWHVVLGVVAVLLGGLAFWSYQQTAELEGVPAARNAALVDGARTSEVKGAVVDAVNTLFSYNYADPGKTDQAVRTLLVGPAVGQYATLFGEVRRQAPAQRLVLTTTVTDSGVRLLDGDRARLLIFADQRSTRGTDGRTSYAAALLAVDAVRRDGRWRISSIDTFTGRP